MKKLFVLMITSFLAYSGESQDCRYLDEVFTEVKQTNSVVYGVNATALTVYQYGQALAQPLVLDLYEPVGDSLAERPLIIVFHSGNFIPFPQNTGPLGTRKDSSVVEMCRRLAKSGYVVASADYRLGWNPTTPDSEILRTGLINAAYRGVQDANTCIRFFKKTFVEQENLYRIDTSRIVLFGDDTGGYLSLNAGALDRYSKIPETDQFCLGPGPGGGCRPMVVEYASGDVEGKVYGVNTPAVEGSPFPEGDTLCYPNHIAYSSSFAASVSLGGAVGDTSWIEPGQPPVIAFHVPGDYSTPYETGIVYIKIAGMLIPVIHVGGSYAVTYKASEVGNNSNMNPWYYANQFQLDITGVADGRTGGIAGLMPIYGDSPYDFNPWDYWDCNTNINCDSALLTNPNMSYEKSKIYIDTIMAFTLPRLVRTLQLDPGCFFIKTEEVITENVEIIVSPNPASEVVTFTAPSDHIIQNVSVFDMKGALVSSANGVHQNHYTMGTTELLSGIYLVRLQFEQGVAACQFVIR